MWCGIKANHIGRSPGGNNAVIGIEKRSRAITDILKLDQGL